MQRQETFEVQQALRLENSFGVLRDQDNVTLEVTIGINSDDYGWFEFYDVETGGDEWYAEGGLWFEGKELSCYDGVFDLLPAIKAKLVEWGYVVEDYDPEIISVQTQKKS